MKSNVRYLGLAAMAVLLLTADGIMGPSDGGRRKTNADVTILSFGSIHGELAPCG